MRKMFVVCAWKMTDAYQFFQLMTVWKKKLCSALELRYGTEKCILLFAFGQNFSL